jgi:hypothetical protein
VAWLWPGYRNSSCFGQLVFAQAALFVATETNGLDDFTP